MKSNIISANILSQLKIDYPSINISFDDEHGLLLMDNHRINLQMGEGEITNVRVRTHSGRNYYQAITQCLVSGNFYPMA